jgi:hypothetical protein
MKRLRLMAAVLLAGGLCGGGALAEEGPTVGSAPSESQRFAREVLLDMARFLGGTQKFTVALRAGYDVVQANGQKVEFGERREVAVERPARFRITQRLSDGREDVTLFDSATITVSDTAENVYARAPQPGDIDASVMYFVRDLKMRMPVAPLFMSRFAGELEKRVLEVDFVEPTDILGEPALHLVGRTELVDFQVWVRDSEQPLPLRMVLSYRTEEAHPQFWVDFSDWNLKPRFGRKTFVFEPAKDSREILFMVQMASEPRSGTAPAGQGPAQPIQE